MDQKTLILRPGPFDLGWPLSGQILAFLRTFKKRDICTSSGYPNIIKQIFFFPFIPNLSNIRDILFRISGKYGNFRQKLCQFKIAEKNYNFFRRIPFLQKFRGASSLASSVSINHLTLVNQFGSTKWHFRQNRFRFRQKNVSISQSKNINYIFLQISLRNRNIFWYNYWNSFIEIG